MTNDTPSLPKPLINDAYWFQYSKTFKDNALKSRDEAAAKLQTLVTWLWGIYTAATALGFSLAGKALPFEAKCLIAAASGGVIAVYWGTVWVQVPKLIYFAPNEVESIEKEAYDRILLTKHKRLKITLLLSVLAAMLVSLSLVVASLTKEKKLQAPSLAVSVQTDTGKSFLSLTSVVPPKTEAVTVTLKPTQAKDSAKQSLTAFYKPTAEGLVQISIPLKGLAPPLEVTLAWMDPEKKLKATLTQTAQESPWLAPKIPNVIYQTHRITLPKKETSC